MTKWIRWSGLLGFVAFITVLVVFWLFAAAPIIKFSIENFGSQAVGAKVDVDEVILGFNPLVLSINGVQVTDKDKPMSNLVSFDSAVADMALFPLLLGKAIIQDMSLQGVEFGSDRQSSGALPSSEKATPSQTTEAEPAKQELAAEPAAKAENSSSDPLPSADDILAREPLLTVSRGEKFKSSLATHKQEIDESLAGVPNEQALRDYQSKLDIILAGKFKSLKDFKARKKALDELQDQFKADRKAIKRASAAIKNGKKDLQSQWSGLKQAPKEDYKNIKGKYTLDAMGTSNLAALLFGKDAGGYAATALEYYEKVSPLLASDDEEGDVLEEAKQKRLAGQFVHFPTDRPLPDFWIKHLSFTASLPMGEVMVTVEDITHQQDVINKATTLMAVGRDMPTIKSLTLNGVLDHRNAKGRDQFDLAIQDWQLKGLNLGLAGLELDNSLLDVNADVIFNGSQMNAQGQGSFNQANFSSNDKTVLAKEMVSALANIDTFSVDGKAQGKLSHPDVSISSDLDSKLSKAFNKRIKQKQDELAQELRKKLADKLLSYGGDYEQQLKQLNASEGSLDGKSKAMGKMAQTEMGDYQSQLKAQAKAKADKKKKELAKKAKDKLKKFF